MVSGGGIQASRRAVLCPRVTGPARSVNWGWEVKRGLGDSDAGARVWAVVWISEGAGPKPGQDCLLECGPLPYIAHSWNLQRRSGGHLLDLRICFSYQRGGGFSQLFEGQFVSWVAAPSLDTSA